MAEQISKQVRAVLVFFACRQSWSRIRRVSYGEDLLKEGPKAINCNNSVSGSWGLLAGAQSYGYVVFLMNDNAVGYVNNTKGWEIGVEPTVVIVNGGVAENLSTSTLTDDA